MQECVRQIYYQDGHFHTCEAFTDEYLYRGKSLYEVMRVQQGVPVFLEDHLDRLKQSASMTGLKIWMSRKETGEMLRELIRRNQSADGNVKVVFNVQPSGSRHVLAYYAPHYYPDAHQYEHGVEAMLYMAVRPNPTAKVINMQLRLEVFTAIIETGVYEALLVNREGYITEGSRSNVFFIRGDTVYTAPDEMVLPGISRKYTLQYLRKEKVKVSLEAVHLDELKNMDAVFLTGTSPKILPVKRITDTLHQPGHPLLRSVMRGYDEYMDDYIKSH